MTPKRTVLLTGATGFLGSNLLKALLSLGYKVVILKRSTSNTWRITNLLNQVTSYNIDIEPLNQAFEDQRIDIVIHTACDYGRNGDIRQIVETNLMYGIKLLDLASSFNTDVFLNTDTFMKHNLNIYTLSKNQFVEWLYKYRGRIQIINLKLEHIYGPLDDIAKFVPWVMSQFKENVEEIKFTQGEQLRDFIYVDDVVSAYITVLQNTAQLPILTEFDVGTGSLIKLRSMVELIKAAYEQQYTASKTQLNFGALPYRDGEMMKVDVKNTALLELGWQPAFEPHIGIKKMIELDLKYVS